MDNPLLGGDNEDFPLNGGKSKLSKLFESEPGNEVSLKYTAPKEPRMRSVVTRNPATVLLKVIMGKTVEAFKMESGKYVSYGKVGAAILGSEEKEHFQIYIYRNDERKITSADIDPGFQFQVHANNYAMFHNRHAEAWSLHFDKSSDLADFCKEVALAKWRSPNGSLTKIVQDTAYGNSERCVEPNDTVVALYRVYSLNHDKQLGKELPKRTLSSQASSSMWETNIIGACTGSTRIIILPQQLMGDWEGVAPHGYDLFLEMEIQQITQQAPKRLDHPSFPQQNSYKRQTKGGEGQPLKTDLLSRISKMGQPLLPFPSFPGKDSDSEPESNETGDSRSVESFRSLGSVGKFSNQRTPTTCAVLPNMQDTVVHDQLPYIKQRHHCTSEDSISHSLSQDFSVNAQLNVLFSEMRTCNAEIRMNLTRLSDRVESVAYKVENNSESMCNKLDYIYKHLDYLTTNNEDSRSSVNLKLAEILELNRNIASCLTEKKNTILPDRSEELRAEVTRLEERNRELQDYVSNAEAGSNALQVKVQELKDHLTLVEKQKEILQMVQDSEKSVECQNCKGASNDSFKSLENILETMEVRCRDLEMNKIELENKNIHLEKRLNKIISEKEANEEAQCSEKEESCKRLRELESELHKTKMAVKQQEGKFQELSDDSTKSTSTNDVSSIIMKVMNMTYKALKKQLTKETGVSQSVHDSLADTLRTVTNAYLSQLNESGSSSLESWPPQDSAPAKPLPDTSTQFRHFSDPTCSTRPQIPDPTNAIGNSHSSFTSDSPLPVAPELNFTTDSESINTSDCIESVSKSQANTDWEQESSSIKSIGKDFKEPTNSSVSRTQSEEKNSNPSADKYKTSKTVDLSCESYNSVPQKAIKPLGVTGISVETLSSLNESTSALEIPTKSDKSETFECGRTDPNRFEEAGSGKHFSSMTNPGDIAVTNDRDVSPPNINKTPPLNTFPETVDPIVSRSTVSKNTEPLNVTSIPFEIPAVVSDPSPAVEIQSKPDRMKKLEDDDLTLCEGGKSLCETAPHDSKVSPDRSHSFRSNSSTESSKSLPFTFVPMIKPEPPPIFNSRSPSPTNHSPIEGNSMSNTAIEDECVEESNSNLSKGSTNRDVWRSQPPPLFDDEVNDEWLL